MRNNIRTKKIIKYNESHTENKLNKTNKSSSLNNLQSINFKLLSVLLFMIVIFTSFIFTFNVEGNTEKNKIYTSVQVEEGDSLWSIAKTYYTEDFDDYNELIDEIKTINNMSSDTIKVGCYIIVPYYINE